MYTSIQAPNSLYSKHGDTYSLEERELLQMYECNTTSRAHQKWRLSGAVRMGGTRCQQLCYRSGKIRPWSTVVRGRHHRQSRVWRWMCRSTIPRCMSKCWPGHCNHSNIGLSNQILNLELYITRSKELECWMRKSISTEHESFRRTPCTLSPNKPARWIRLTELHWETSFWISSTVREDDICCNCQVNFVRLLQQSSICSEVEHTSLLQPWSR